MTGERLYENTLAMLTAYEAVSGDQFAKAVIAHPEEWEKNKISPFYASAARLIIEARRLMDRKTTKTSVVSAVKRILKNAQSGHRKNYDGIFLYDGKFAVCDGYRLLLLNEDIAQAPHTKCPSANHDFKKVIAEAKKDGETLRLPTIGELKEYNVAQKRELGKFDTPRYCIDDYLWANPYYLIDMLDALPGCTAYKPDNPTALIYFKAENGEGFLCTIRPPEDANT